VNETSAVLAAEHVLLFSAHLPWIARGLVIFVPFGQRVIMFLRFAERVVRGILCKRQEAGFVTFMPDQTSMTVHGTS